MAVCAAPSCLSTSFSCSPFSLSAADVSSTMWSLLARLCFYMLASASTKLRPSCYHVARQLSSKGWLAYLSIDLSLVACQLLLHAPKVYRIQLVTGRLASAATMPYRPWPYRLSLGSSLALGSQLASLAAVAEALPLCGEPPSVVSQAAAPSHGLARPRWHHRWIEVESRLVTI